ncbi:MAG: hypothetical protein ACUVQP_07890, partial [Bacteroidales bacterium]
MNKEQYKHAIPSGFGNIGKPQQYLEFIACNNELTPKSIFSSKITTKQNIMLLLFNIIDYLILYVLS